MLWFTLATTTPVALLLAAGMLGGFWSVLALVYLTAFAFAVDLLVQGAAARRKSNGEFPVGEGLAVFLGLAHFPLLLIAVYAISGAGGFGWAERLACFLGFGIFFGQVSNPNAHELIHKQARWPRRLGMLIYTSLLFGHHTSAHTRVHHVWVATPRDPNSPRHGESFYRFWPRAWIGSFIEGLRAENALRARATRRAQLWTHPYIVYIGGALAACGIAGVLFGPAGLVALITVTGYAQMQLLVSDYVQHYGLTRAVSDMGKPEPVSSAHSWNAPHFFSSALMLNAPRHSDHHMHPLRSYPSLRLDADTMPTLPRSLPAMGALALWPPLWRRVMDPRVAALRAPRD
ncbi:alkane 1-monooxygenase [Shimia sp. W99]